MGKWERLVLIAGVVVIVFGLLFDTLDTLASIIRTAVVLALILGAAHFIARRSRGSSPKSF